MRIFPALSFAASIFHVPARDFDDFWKFLNFLLYLFFNVSKVLAADPIKRKGKKT